MTRDRERPRPRSDRGCLLAMLGLITLVLCGAFVLITGLVLTGRAGPPEIDREIGRVAGTSPPILAVGWSGTQWLAGWRTERGVVIHALATGQSTTASGLSFVSQLIPTESGVIAFGGDRFAVLDRDGRPVGAVRTLPGLPPATERTAVYDENRLLIAGTESGQPVGTVSFMAVGLDGISASPALTIPAGSRFPGRPGIVPLGPALVLVAWQGSGERDGVSVAVVDVLSRQVRPPRLVHQAGSGGAIQCCWAAPRSLGGAFVVWQDSTPGAWEIFAIAVGPTGDPGQPVQLSAGDGRDDIRPSLAWGGERTVAGWLTGVHFGPLTVSGSGSVAIRSANGVGSGRTFRADESIETYAIGVSDQEIAIVAATRDRDGYRIAATTVR